MLPLLMLLAARPDMEIEAPPSVRAANAHRSMDLVLVASPIGPRYRGGWGERFVATDPAVDWRMTTSIYWFRNDLRLTDNAALAKACALSDRLILVYVKPPGETQTTRWGFPRWSGHRRNFRDQGLEGLKTAVAEKGGALLIVDGEPEEIIPAMAKQLGADRVFCESVAAPEEVTQVAALRKAGLTVFDQWQSSMLDPSDLPFDIASLPEVFTAFRQAVERADVQPLAPLAAPGSLTSPALSGSWAPSISHAPQTRPQHSSFPFSKPAFHGSEAAALAHVEHYFRTARPRSYKSTRNGLFGSEYSTKFSPWLAIGALSPRTVFQHLKAHEDEFGANDSTYWIWFELLWRDFFRFSSLKHGRRLFHARGLSHDPPPPHDPEAFARWCGGQTGHAFVDAGLRELVATGFLSNRMRQVVASYLVHDLACDWRAGAAWFESQLIDYDVCSNQGNWLYVGGRGADPRQGRRFHPDKQATDYDRDCLYRSRWASPDDRRPTNRLA